MGNDTDGFWLMHSVRLCWTSGSATLNSPNTGAANQRAKENCRKGTIFVPCWLQQQPSESKICCVNCPFFLSVYMKACGLVLCLASLYIRVWQPQAQGCVCLTSVQCVRFSFLFLLAFCVKTLRRASPCKLLWVHVHKLCLPYILGHPQRCLAGCWSWCHCAQLLFSGLARQRTCCPTERVQHRNG